MRWMPGALLVIALALPGMGCCPPIVKGNPCPPPQAATALPDGPRAALLRFVKAIERGDCADLSNQAPPAMLHAYGPMALEDGCRRQLEDLRRQAPELLKAAERLSPVGPNRHEAVWRAGGKLVIVKEAGRWYILDF